MNAPPPFHEAMVRAEKSVAALSDPSLSPRALHRGVIAAALALGRVEDGLGDEPVPPAVRELQAKVTVAHRQAQRMRGVVADVRAQVRP